MNPPYGGNTRAWLEKAGFIETCNKINQNLLEIFKTFKDDPLFNFWILNKRGDPTMKISTAIIHGPELSKASEIEKALTTSYNLKTIG